MKLIFKYFIKPILLIGYVIPLFSGSPLRVQAQTPQPEHPVYIYLFWGDGCPHCAKAKPYFEELAKQYPNIVYRAYEVYYDPAGQEAFLQMAKKAGIEQFAVPTIFIGPYYVQGYSEEMHASVIEVVEYCTQQGCEDAGAGVIGVNTQSAASPTAEMTAASTENLKTELPPTMTSSPQPTAALVNTATPPAIPSYEEASSGSLNQSRQIEIPFLGKVQTSQASPFFSTVLIALVDGFNPCSLWVLTMLLALTLHTGSRKKVIVIGLVFLTITAGIYALFIAGLFSVLSVAGFLVWIRVLVALVAGFFGAVNMKDFFWYKQGFSLSIADEKKPGIFKKMRNVLDASQSFPAMVGSTAVLAAGVSLVEFSCTAGFPVIWTNLLSAQNITGTTFLLLLALYMVIYQLDEMMVFGVSVVTLKASRMEEKHGRVLKLVSGVLLLTLSLVMLINPAWMNELNSSLLVFGFAFLVTILILVFKRILSDPGKSRVG